MGPAALRTAGLLTLLDGLGFEVKDHGDLSIGDVAELADAPPDNAKHYREIQRWTRALSARAYELARSGAIPIFLGGDHTLSMGSVNGIARHWHEMGRELFVLWLDAHADYNTPATTITGNMHGMSAAFLCGEPGLDGLLGEEPRSPIDPDQLELFGTRSIDKLEKDLLRSRRISIADMRQIDEFGVGVLIRRVIDKVRARNGVLHVSFDVDFLDPSLAPGVGTTVPGGATYREAHLVMEMLHDSGLVRSRRHRRTQSVPRRAGPHRAHRGGTDRQPVRPADHRPANPEQRDRAGRLNAIKQRVPYRGAGRMP